jgi:hypothetical protein
MTDVPPEDDLTDEERNEVRELIVLVDDLNKTWEGKEEERQETKRLATRANINSTIAIIAAVVAIASVVVSAIFIDNARDAADKAQFVADENASIAKTNCENANKTREGQQNIWQEQYKVERASANAQGYPPEGPVQTWYREFMEWKTGTAPVYAKDGSVEGFMDSDKYTGVLALRNCENLAEVAPDPGPAPDFQDALDEALEQERAED